MQRIIQRRKTMSKEYIEKEAFVAEMKKRQEAAKAWLKKAKDQETRVRADAVSCFIQEVKWTLEKITPADVKPVVRGEWVEGEYVGEVGYEIKWHCSSCGFAVLSEEYPAWHYCPNCGADMRKEANDDER
jgi:rubrerythrin